MDSTYELISVPKCSFVFQPAALSIRIHYYYSLAMPTAVIQSVLIYEQKDSPHHSLLPKAAFLQHCLSLSNGIASNNAKCIINTKCTCHFVQNV